MAEFTVADRYDKLWLWFLGDPAAPRLAGRLRLVESGKGVSLQYAPSWLESGFALSEDLTLVDLEHLPRAKGLAAGAVDDARPDRWGERLIQYLDKPRRLSLMEFLFLAGDDRFGALGVSTSPDSYQPRPTGPLPRLQDAQQLSGIVAKINAKEPISNIERRMMHAGGSFGGAKPKALIQSEGAQWVIKFFNGEPVDVPLIEHAAMTLAAKAEIRVATTQPVRLAAEHAVIVQRYDRARAGRVHCVSAGTALRALAAAGQAPDLSYPALAQLLRRAGDTQHDANRRDMGELFRRMVFNILIDNTDDHEKNHTLMFTSHDERAKLRLSPAYDVLPTNSGQGHQEFIVGDAAGDSTLANAMSQCEQFGLSRDNAADQVLQVVAVVDGWREHFEAAGVTPGDLDSLAERIDEGELGAQRADFKPEDFAHKRPRRRQGPFA